QVGAALEQVGRERMAEEMGVDAARLEPGAIREPPEDEERARAGQCAAARVEEQIRTVPMVELRPAEREVAAERLGRGAAERHESFFPALPDDPYDAALE